MRAGPSEEAEPIPGDETQRVRPFGVRAVERGFLPEAEVLEALKAQYKAKVLLGKHLLLGEVLLLRGALSPVQHQALCDETREHHEEPEDLHGGRFFGDVAMEMGFVHAGQVFEALNIQYEEQSLGERHRLIGEILFERGHLTADQVRAVVERLVGR